MISIFTIQNVPIKFISSTTEAMNNANLQYKMFLLNEKPNIAHIKNNIIYNTKCLFFVDCNNTALPPIACVLRVYYASDF